MWKLLVVVGSILEVGGLVMALAGIAFTIGKFRAHRRAIKQGDLTSAAELREKAAQCAIVTAVGAFLLNVGSILLQLPH